MKEFRLVPFSTSSLDEAIDVRTMIRWDDPISVLVIEFLVTGWIGSGLKIPPISDVAQRRVGLWETTCFECFLGASGQERYWEINLSPSGDWNIFRLDRYRENLREESIIETLPCWVETCGDRLIVGATLDIQKLGLCRDSIELSVTSVLEDTMGNIRYWAVAHAGAEADFHLRESFVISGL